MKAVGDSDSPGRTVKRTILGACAGAFLGVVLPIPFGMLCVWVGGDPSGVAAVTFLPIVTLPLGLYFGGMNGARSASGGD